MLSINSNINTKQASLDSKYYLTRYINYIVCGVKAS